MLDRARLRQLLGRMMLIRGFEERLRGFYDYRGYFGETDEARSAEELLTCVSYDFAIEGMIGGAVHLSIGQEAVSVGVCAHLGPRDSAFSSHRSHGHFLAKGGSAAEALAELMGRSTGCSRGRGGSMHLFDPDLGFLGGNGIIGAQMALGLGPAFAAKYRGEPYVSVPFFGDGGANIGTFTEALNLAALWKLPVIFVCENNLYANATPVEIAFAEPDIARRAAGYGLPGVAVDGQDLEAVYKVAGEAVERARAGQGPTFIEARTYRFEGHCGHASHQNQEECERWRQRDPIALLVARMTADGLLTEEELAAMMAEVEAELDAAEAFAKASPLPEAAPLVSDGSRAEEVGHA